MINLYSMDFSAYQKQANTTAQYPNAGNNLYYPALGLGGEAGEVLNKVKKIMRDSDGTITDEHRTTLTNELGDVLWYVATMATELGIDLNEVVETNLAKLASRKERGVLHGDGDHR